VCGAFPSVEGLFAAEKVGQTCSELAVPEFRKETEFSFIFPARRTRFEKARIVGRS